MMQRKYNDALMEAQKELRLILLPRLHNFNILNIRSFLSIEGEVFKKIKIMELFTAGTKDGAFVRNYHLVLSSIFHLLKWGEKEFNANNGISNLSASKAHIEQVCISDFDYIPDFQVHIQELIQLIIETSEVKQIVGVIDRFIKIPFPMIYTTTVDPFAKVRPRKHLQEKAEKPPPVFMIALQLTINGEPWANPQVLKPKVYYTIKGRVSLNQWADGYDTIILQPVSTLSRYELNLPPIRKNNNELDFDITGNIFFEYAQSSFEDSISIRLLGYFSNSSQAVKYPTDIIGYDQLTLKVLDDSSYPLFTGFKSMDKRVYEIITTLEKELPRLDEEEKKNFLHLLSGIINYQGYCLREGIYKKQKHVREDVFRDNLIQHLIAQPYLGEDINKEAHIAGGRVEIGFKGIIAELKVENTISSRQELLKKYGKQPVAYSSGYTKQLSILCILDLTEKIYPPASPLNDVVMFTPEVHGFDNTSPEYPSKVVMVIIDGNTKKPSDYSR